MNIISFQYFELYEYNFCLVKRLWTKSISQYNVFHTMRKAKCHKFPNESNVYYFFLHLNCTAITVLHF